MVSGYWMLDAGCSILDTGLWSLVTDRWKLIGIGRKDRAKGAGRKAQGTRCQELFKSKIRNLKSKIG
jgi:hypothetical protein